MKLKHLMSVTAATGLLAMSASSFAAIQSYSQDFEGLVQSDGAALANDGWLVFGIDTVGQYGPFPAPNGGAAFSAIDAGQGGPAQGAQQLSIYSDYNNGNHPAGNVETLVFQEQFNNIDAGDVGSTWNWTFDTKAGNITGSSTAYAFIKLLDPNNGFSQDFFTSVATGLNANWQTDILSITIDGTMTGKILQYGFGTIATNYEGSGVFYDNLSFASASAVPVPAAAWLFGSALAGLAAYRKKSK